MIYTLSLHDALPICKAELDAPSLEDEAIIEEAISKGPLTKPVLRPRSEEHTSELQSHHDLVCRLLLETKKPRPHSTGN